MKKNTVIFALLISLLPAMAFSEIRESGAEIIIKNIDRLPGEWDKSHKKIYSVEGCSSRPSGNMDPNDLRCTYLGSFPGGVSHSKAQGMWEEVRNGKFRYTGNHACGQYVVIIRESHFDKPERIIYRSNNKVQCGKTMHISF
jgi:hypothetical protein